MSVQPKLMKKAEVLQFIKFTLFSISAGAIELGVFTLLTELTSWSYWPCYLPALILSVVWNCTFNRKFTFKSAVNMNKAMALALLFYVPFTPLSTWWGDALEKAGWNEYVILIGTMVINFVLEFVYQRYFVFRDSIGTAVKKEQNEGRDD